MPDEPTLLAQGAGEKPEDNGQPAASGTPAESTAAFDYDAWLAQQPDSVRAGLEAHMTGLKSALEKERKANKKREDEAARKAEEARTAELSELGKAQKRLADLEKQNGELLAAQRLQAAREALRQAAGKAKIEFVSASAEADALEFALRSAKLDEDGAVENADDVWKQIVKDRDYLVKRAERPAGDTSAARRGESSTPVMTEAEKLEFAARYGVRPEYLKS